MKRRSIFGLFIALLLAGCGTSMDPFVGLEQAEREAEYYRSQLTATTVSRELAVTETNAAFGLMQTQTAWPYTATAISWTPTPLPTSTPVPTATLDIQATGTAESILLAMERERSSNQIRAMSGYVVGFLAMVLAVMLTIVVAKRLSKIPTPIHDGTGKPMPMLDVVDGTWSDIDRAPNGTARVDKSYLKALPQITAERQDVVTSRAQMIDLKSRSKVTNEAVRRLLESQGVKMLPKPEEMDTAKQLTTADDFNLPLPPWEFIERWDGTSKPLGFGKTGLITAKAASPHILISGKTGSGKTFYMMRTLTAASLAKGSQVVNIGYSNAGYGVFERHVNYHNVQLPDPRYVIECLAQVYDELKERKALIGGDMVEWEHWPDGQPPRPFLDVNIDELGNMAEDIHKDYDNGPALTKELWSKISRIANEGRKVGIRFVAALQDPTAKSVDLRFRRNCTLVAFRQGDMDQSRAFLGTIGAEQLSEGHFMASLDSLVVGGGFSPTDAEILDYLAKSPVRPVEKPKWIGSVDGNQLPAREEPIKIIAPAALESLPEVKPANEIAEMAERIRAQWSPDMSGRRVAKLLGLSQYGGSLATKTDKVIEYLTATTKPATTTEKQPELGSFAPEMA